MAMRGERWAVRYTMTARTVCVGAPLVLLTLVVCYPCFADGGFFPLEIVDQPTVETGQRALLHVQEADADARFRTLLSPEDMAEDIAFVPRDVDYLGTTITVFPEESKIRLGAMVALPVLLSWPMVRARKRTGHRRWSMAALLLLLLPLVMG